MTVVFINISVIFFLKIFYNICLEFLFILILGDSLVLPEQITFTKERFLNVKNIMTKGNTSVLSVIQSSSIRRLSGGLVQSIELSQALILASRCSNKCIFQCGLHRITCLGAWISSERWLQEGSWSALPSRRFM